MSPHIASIIHEIKVTPFGASFGANHHLACVNVSAHELQSLEILC